MNHQNTKLHPLMTSSIYVGKSSAKLFSIALNTVHNVNAKYLKHEQLIKLGYFISNSSTHNWPNVPPNMKCKDFLECSLHGPSQGGEIY